MSHDVVFSIPVRSLGKADVEFRVKLDGSMLGTLKVSKGSVVWVPKDYEKGHKLSWSKFDEAMRKAPKER